MAELSQIYRSLRCPKCEHRLNKPLELNCGHIICRTCLETILRNHRTNARCPVCEKSLGDYDIEHYSYLPVKHLITKLLSSLTDVNRCETCHEFTAVESCPRCSNDQCDSCRDQHEATHDQTKQFSNIILDQLSKEELEILHSIKNDLTEQEFEDFLQTAKLYLNNALSKSNGTSISMNDDRSVIDVEKKSAWTEPKIYDWSTHEKFTADDVLNSTPERVRELLRLNFTPRPYQIRMVRAGLKKENSLVCLQTGAGKTFVAGIVAKFFYILSQQRLSQSPGSPSTASRRFKAVFLVPIKALVDQQCEAFGKVFIDQSDSILSKIDTQVGERFKDIYQRFDIFFFTVQKFANFVEAKYADLTKFDLVMIDECHHCYDNHPINSMMRHYHRLKLSDCKVPQIIALTGSVGTNKKNAFNHLVHLCANLDCFDICAIHRGAEEDELRRSTNTPLADTIVQVPKEEDNPIIIKLKDDVMKAIASRLGYDITTMDNQKMDNFLVIEHQNACKANDRDAIIGTDYLRKLNRFLFYYDDLPLDQCIQWLDETLQESAASKPTLFDVFCQKKLKEFRECVTMQMSRSTPVKAKLRKLVHMIIQLHESGCRGLVLVRTKFHTVALEEFLNKRSELIEKQISVGHLTGQGSAEDLGLPGTQQATVLKEFRKGTKSLLVATDVAQEGLDVAECSYVVRYEFVSNEIGSVQSRGRARAAQSKCFLITESSSLNYQRELENRQREAEMKEAIDEWRKIGTKEFEKLVQKEQDELATDLCKNDTISTAPSSSQSTEQIAKSIHCRFCDTYLCHGSHLRRQGTTIVCTDSTFEQRVKPPKTAGAKFVCPNTTCHRELGVVVLLLRNVPACALQITALKFFFHGEENPRLLKKWSQYQGHMKSL